MTTACPTSTNTPCPSVVRALLLLMIFMAGLLSGCSQEHEEPAPDQDKSNITQQKQIFF